MIEEDTSKAQLLRADHLLFVTLKYARTADVIKNAIQRLIAAFEYAFTDLLEVAKKKKKIKEIPPLPLTKAELIKKIYPRKKEIKEYINLYLLLKRIDKLKYTGREEFRKNVTLVTDEVEVNVETLKEYYLKTKEFIEFVDMEVKNEK